MNEIIEYIGTIDKDFSIKKYTKVVICGVGTIGKKTYSYIKENIGKIRIVLCDSNIEVQQHDYDNLVVYSYEEATRENKDSLFLVTNLDVKRTCIYLKNRGIERIHIIR